MELRTEREPAVYASNTSPISGLTSIFPYFWCLVEILLSQRPHLLIYQSANHYTHHLVPWLQDAVEQFTQITSALKRRQRNHYDSQA